MSRLRLALLILLFSGSFGCLDGFAHTAPLPFPDLRLFFTDTIPAKTDSFPVTKDSFNPATKPADVKDTTSAAKKVKVPHDPRKATIRSAILPGWGQVYNRKYWKVPIVYAALGITGYVFFDNIKTYREVRFAYQVTVGKDTASWDKVAPYLRVFVENNASSSLDNYRREFRRKNIL